MSKWTVRKGLRTVKNVVFSYSEVEKLVRTATSNEPWGASEDLKLKIADATYDLHRCEEVVRMLWRRIADQANWRHVYKGLVLLEYLCRAGSDQVVADALEHVFDLDALTRYQYINEDGTDVGGNVRKKAQDVAYLLRNKDVLWRERDAFRQSNPPPTTRGAETELDGHAPRSRSDSIDSSSRGGGAAASGADDSTQPDWDDEHTTASAPATSRPLPPLPPLDMAAGSASSSARPPTQSDIEPWLSRTLDPPQSAMMASRTRRTRRGSFSSPAAASPAPLRPPADPISSTDGGGSSSSATAGGGSSTRRPAGPAPAPLAAAVAAAPPATTVARAAAAPPPMAAPTPALATSSTAGSWSASSFPADLQELASPPPPAAAAAPMAGSATSTLGRVSSLYRRELEMVSHMTEDELMRALSEDMHRTEMSDVFQREEQQRRMQRYGWKALRKLWGTGDCAVLLSIVAQRLVQGRTTYEEAERVYGTREINVDAERRALLQWLYNNGSKYPALMDGLLVEALEAFPSEPTEQVAYLKYITKMAKSHQYLSLGELAGGAYRDNYVLVILRENHAQTGLELSGMVAPPDARRAIYALFGDEAHYSLLEPLRAYSPAQASVFSQAPPALQPELEAVYAEQQAPRSLARRASWQLRTPGSRDQLPLASPVRPAAVTSPPRAVASASGTLWEAATPLVSLDELGKPRSSGAPPPARGRPATGHDSLVNLAQSRTDAAGAPKGLPTPLIPAPALGPTTPAPRPPTATSTTTTWPDPFADPPRRR